MQFYLNQRQVAQEEFEARAAEATDVRVENCAGLKTMPAMPKATDVRVENCAGLIIVVAGQDSRGYTFKIVNGHGGPMVSAGCRHKTIEQARQHWGVGGPSDRADCRALVEKLAAHIEKKRKAA